MQTVRSSHVAWMCLAACLVWGPWWSASFGQTAAAPAAAPAPAATPPAAPPAAAAPAASFSVLPIGDLYKDTQSAAFKAELTFVRELVRDAKKLDDGNNRARFLAFFQQYLFPLFTQPDGLDKLGPTREEIQRSIFSAKDPAVQALIRGETVKYMRGIIGGKFHPVSRFNAMLMLGELNQREASGRQFPDPYMPALADFYNAIKDPAGPDSLRLAALIGVLRHAKLDWARPVDQRIAVNARTAFVQQMLAILKSPQPDNRSPQAHVWFQRRAIEILAALGSVGRMPEVSNEISRMLTDPNANLDLRCAAAEAVRHWRGAPATLDGLAMSKNLVNVALAACDRELTWIDETKKRDKEKEEKKKLAGAAATGMGGYGMGGMEGYGTEGAGAESGMGMGMGMPGMSGMSGMPGGEGYGAEGMMGGYGTEGYGMEGYGMGGTMMGPVKPADPRVDLSRRRLKYVLVCSKDAIRAMAPFSPQNQAELTKMTKSVDELIAAVDLQQEAAQGATKPAIGALPTAPAARPKERTLDALSAAITDKMAMLKVFAPPPPANAPAPIDDAAALAEPPADAADEPSAPPSPVPQAPAGQPPAAQPPAAQPGAAQQ